MSNGSKHHAPCIAFILNTKWGFSPIFFLFVFLQISSSCLMEPLKAFFVIILGLSSGTECVYILINLLRD